MFLQTLISSLQQKSPFNSGKDLKESVEILYELDKKLKHIDVFDPDEVSDLLTNYIVEERILHYMHLQLTKTDNIAREFETKLPALEYYVGQDSEIFI